MNKNFNKDVAKKYFKCSKSERAAFEAGIKLATIYHQFTGIPFNRDTINSLVKAITESISVQPFVEDVKIEIKTKEYKTGKENYNYTSLTGDMIKAKIVINYMEVKAEGNMEYIPEMNYPLMYTRIL